jgi:hypothetical protein
VRVDEAFIFITLFLGIPWILGTIFRSFLNHKQFMRVVQLKAEMNAKLLDRIGTDPQALEYFKGEVQREMFQIDTPTPRMPSVYGRMLTSAQLAAVLLSAGIVCVWFRGFLVGENQLPFLFLGSLGIGLGVGALVSAGAAYGVSRLWENENNGRTGASA